MKIVFYILFMPIFIILASISLVNAHSWFPNECCGGNDCKEIIEFSSAGDKWRIGTKETIVLVSKTFPIRSSLDNKKYICIHNGTVYCIFFPASY